MAMISKLKWVVLLVVIMGAVVWLRTALQSTVHPSWRLTSASNQNLGAADATRPTTSAPVTGDSNRPMTKDEATAIKGYLDTSFANLSESRPLPLPPLAVLLDDVLLTQDQAAIFKAFHDAVFDRMARMEDIIPIFKGYLRHKDPYVRFRAAQHLYIVGDRSGYKTLLDFVKSETPVGRSDLRIIASAIILGKYRERGAADEVLRLFSRLYASGQDRSGISEALELFGTWPNETKNLLVAYPTVEAMREYGIYRRDDLIPKIRETFLKSDKLDVKNAAAWALASMTGEPQYIDFLIQTAEPVIKTKTKAQWNEMDENAKAIKYLGCLRDPRAKETLERALDSPNGQVAGYALVNLLFNQGGSDKARDFVVRQLGAWGTSRILPHDLLYHVASKLDDPAVRRAGEKADQHDGLLMSWRFYSTTRKNWPIYNWIDQYVVKLNEN